MIKMSLVGVTKHQGHNSPIPGKGGTVGETPPPGVECTHKHPSLSKIDFLLEVTVEMCKGNYSEKRFCLRNDHKAQTNCWSPFDKVRSPELTNAFPMDKLWGKQHCQVRKTFIRFNDLQATRSDKLETGVKITQTLAFSEQNLISVNKLYEKRNNYQLYM